MMLCKIKVMDYVGSEEQCEIGGAVEIVSKGEDDLYATSGGRTKFVYSI